MVSWWELQIHYNKTIQLSMLSPLHKASESPLTSKLCEREANSPPLPWNLWMLIPFFSLQWVPQAPRLFSPIHLESCPLSPTLIQFFISSILTWLGLCFHSLKYTETVYYTKGKLLSQQFVSSSLRVLEQMLGSNCCRWLHQAKGQMLGLLWKPEITFQESITPLVTLVSRLFYK